MAGVYSIFMNILETLRNFHLADPHFLRGRTKQTAKVWWHDLLQNHPRVPTSATNLLSGLSVRVTCRTFSVPCNSNVWLIIRRDLTKCKVMRRCEVSCIIMISLNLYFLHVSKGLSRSTVIKCRSQWQQLGKKLWIFDVLHRPDLDSGCRISWQLCQFRNCWTVDVCVCRYASKCFDISDHKLIP